VRRTHHLLTAILFCASLLAPVAYATQTVRLHATLEPERLGHATTVGFAFQITTPTGKTPSPLTHVDVSYPGNLGIALSELGLATCTPTTLEILGPEGCPANSIMGHGTATAEIPIGPAIERETATITLVRAPTANGHLTLLFYADALSPVNAQLVLPGALLPAGTPRYGGRIDIDVPLVPSLPDGPDVAVVKLTSTLGPEHLTYYQHTRNGHTTPYNPKGILLPDTCPHGGFPFAAKFGFQDGTRASAHTTVPCPRHHRTGL
jgi:hypothetical protein